MQVELDLWNSLEGKNLDINDNDVVSEKGNELEEQSTRIRGSKRGIAL